jgi:hypothetical protein
MDFLANEGLTASNLFRAVANPKLIESTMQSVLQGERVNFVQLNDPALCTGMLLESLKRLNKPLFPTHLLEVRSYMYPWNIRSIAHKLLCRTYAFVLVWIRLFVMIR